jgi:SAM-dependent methyltransferase
MIPKIVKVKAQNFFRRLHLLSTLEYFQYLLRRFSLRKSNLEFVRANPAFSLPPPHLAYDAYSAPDWNFYKTSGEGTADFLAAIIFRYFPNTSELSVYEWGCGPGRVIRNLPSRLPAGAKIYGSDYNSETIEWCSKNLTSINFNLNELEPPLPFLNEKFQFIYCISVFTHLSESNGLIWAEELYRVLVPGGLLVITTAGDYSYETDLLQDEKDIYRKHGIVTRGEYQEGKKMYLARHNPSYVKSVLLKRFEFLEHSTAGFPFISQDFWLVRKSKKIE